MAEDEYNSFLSSVYTRPYEINYLCESQTNTESTNAYQYITDYKNIINNKNKHEKVNLPRICLSFDTSILQIPLIDDLNIYKYMMEYYIYLVPSFFPHPIRVVVINDIVGELNNNRDLNENISLLNKTSILNENNSLNENRDLNENSYLKEKSKLVDPININLNEKTDLKEINNVYYTNKSNLTENLLKIQYFEDEKYTELLETYKNSKIPQLLNIRILMNKTKLFFMSLYNDLQSISDYKSEDIKHIELRFIGEYYKQVTANKKQYEKVKTVKFIKKGFGFDVSFFVDELFETNNNNNYTTSDIIRIFLLLSNNEFRNNISGLVKIIALLGDKVGDEKLLLIFTMSLLRLLEGDYSNNSISTKEDCGSQNDIGLKSSAECIYGKVGFDNLSAIPLNSCDSESSQGVTQPTISRYTLTNNKNTVPINSINVKSTNKHTFPHKRLFYTHMILKFLFAEYIKTKHHPILIYLQNLINRFDLYENYYYFLINLYINPKISNEIFQLSTLAERKKLLNVGNILLGNDIMTVNIDGILEFQSIIYERINSETNTCRVVVKLDLDCFKSVFITNIVVNSNVKTEYSVVDDKCLVIYFYISINSISECGGKDFDSIPTQGEKNMGSVEIHTKNIVFIYSVCI
ncbi:hypothetical protein CDIK_3456 [Cucumispora dikerogammari]|nr:hypothetical protein CDIK_3456 [Cucumispora dikerogammari]